MNAMDRDLGGEAQVRYGDGDFSLLRPGRWVMCAVSGRRIAIEALRYWNPELQEAYAGPEEALARWKSLQRR